MLGIVRNTNKLVNKRPNWNIKIMGTCNNHCAVEGYKDNRLK